MSASARSQSYRPETHLVHAGTLRSQFGETSEALFLTQGYVYDSSRRPSGASRTRTRASSIRASPIRRSRCSRQRMAALEGAEAARATATGMAAVTAALLGQLKAGDHVVAAKALFGSCRYVVEDFLPRFGIASTLVDGTDLDAVEERGAAEHQDLLPRKPDQPDARSDRHRRGRRRSRTRPARRSWSTTCSRRRSTSSRSQLGADCVVYSATKHIDGQGRCLGGVILGSEKFIQDNVHTLIRQTGPSISPFNAWVLLKGLETLRGARAAADRHRGRPSRTRSPSIRRSRALIYPGRPDHPQAAIAQKQMRGGSTLVAFEVEGGKAGAFRFQDALKLVRISNNLGDAKSLITHPATTTHQRLDAGGARRARHQRRAGAALLRARTSRRSSCEDLLTALEAV